MYDFSFIKEDAYIFVVWHHRNDDVSDIVDNVLSYLFGENETEITDEIDKYNWFRRRHQYYDEFVEQMKETITGFCEVFKAANLQDSPADVPNGFCELIGHQNIIESLHQMLANFYDDSSFIDECIERLFNQNQGTCIDFYKEHYCFRGVMNNYHYDKMHVAFTSDVELRILCEDFFNGYNARLIG